MKEFTVTTDEMFTVTRTVRARNHREAAIKAINGCPDGGELAFDQQGIGYVEGVPVGVCAEDETEGQEFDLDDLMNDEYPEDDDA